MSVVDKKKEIFAKIAAAIALTEGLPKLKLSASFPSINNGGNSITFLTDLIKSLIGYEALVTSVVDILTNSLDEIEREIKKALKQELKNIVSCGVDPSLPNYIKSTGNGITVEISKVDFLDLLKTEPDSVGGKLLYNDITNPLVDSSDFNTFLYGVIQDDGNTHTWKGIFDITFNSLGSGSIPNNTLTIKANSAYDLPPKTLTDLNNNFIDSIKLFNAENIVNNIVDSIFGSISISINKTRKQLENEAKINNVIDSMINADGDDVIDDSYFTFTNEEILIQEESANTRKNGIVNLECCNKVAASVPVEFLTSFNEEMGSVTSISEKKEVISTNLNKMANQNTINSPNTSDNISIKLNFVQQIINNLTKSIINIIISPKVAVIFLVNYKIIYGQLSTFAGGTDFIKQNKNLIDSIMKKISGMIIKILINIALKKIGELVAEMAIKKQIEKGKSSQSQLLSLVGIPQEILRRIKGLT
jgi:hypothetical protein